MLLIGGIVIALHQRSMQHGGGVCRAPRDGPPGSRRGCGSLSQYYLLPLFLVEALRRAQRGVSPIHRHTPAAVSGLVVKHPQLPTDRELGRMGGSQQLED